MIFQYLDRKKQLEIENNMGSDESKPSQNLNSNELMVKSETNKSKNDYKTLQTRQLKSIPDKNWDSIANITSNMTKYFNNKKDELPTLNIMILGKTGAGKSTLINTVFRENLATTGTGKPVTDMLRVYSKPGFPLQIYDTPGLELKESQQNNLKNKIYDIIDKRAKLKDVSQSIHCIWYCISSISSRFEDTEIEFIKTFTEGIRLTNVPVIIVLTKSYFDEDVEEMISEIEKLNLNIIQIVPVLAKQKGDRAPYGLSNLIDIMDTCLPAIMKETLSSVQKVSLSYKRKCAFAAVASYCTAAGAVAASPIPFSDCLILIPTEAAMIASIMAIYGVECPMAFVTEFLTITIGCGSVTLLGQFAVSNIIKCIPGAGSVVGAVVSASAASVLTGALGSTFIPIIEQVYKGEIKLDEFDEKKVKELFMQNLKKKKK